MAKKKEGKDVSLKQYFIAMLILIACFAIAKCS